MVPIGFYVKRTKEVLVPIEIAWVSSPSLIGTNKNGVKRKSFDWYQ